MDGHQAVPAQQAAWRTTGERPTCPQRHILGVAVRGARDLPDRFGPYTTCYNRFVRWRQAGVWDEIMNALAGTHDAAAQMIDTSIVPVHQQGVKSESCWIF
jgi:transposase